MLQHTTMAIAFSNCVPTPSSLDNGILHKVVAGLDRYSFRTREGKDWTAKLSYKTARYLASKGVQLQ